MKYPPKDSDNDTVKELKNKYGGKKNGWVGIDKNFVQYLPIDRPYTELEAMLSYTVDIDNGVNKSERSYARIWQWSRTKVKKFLTEIAEPERGHHPYQFRATTRPPVFFINNNLWQQKSQSKANFEPEQSQSEATTINPNPNPNPTSPPISPPGGSGGRKKSSLSQKEFIEFCEHYFSEIGQARMFNALANELADFWNMRKGIKKSIKTEVSVKRLINTLAEESNLDVKMAAKILNQSTANEWQGVFPLKQANGKPTWRTFKPENGAATPDGRKVESEVAGGFWRLDDGTYLKPWNDTWLNVDGQGRRI